MSSNIPNTTILSSSNSIWNTDLEAVGCMVCGQVFLVSHDFLPKKCPNCAKGPLNPQPARMRPEPPESILAFEKKPNDLRQAVEKFVQEVWLRSDDFATEKLLSRLTPIFWPMWMIDSTIQGNWEAEVGFNYQVKSSQEAYQNGQWQTKEVVETRIRWENRLGQIHRHHNNVVAAALEQHNSLSEKVGKYAFERVQNYSPTLVDHAAIQIPDLLPENSWPLAKQGLEKRAGQDCQAASGANHIRNFKIQANFTDQHWTQLLLPIYTTYYTDDNGKPRVIFINGQTGKIAGVRLASQQKGWMWAAILAGSAILFLILGVILTSLTAILAPLAIVGTILIFLAVLLGVGAIIPAVWPWQWNRKQENSS